MSRMVLLNVRTFAGAVDLTGSTNKSEINASFETLDQTTYGSNGWKEFAAGLATTEVSVAGFWDAGTGLATDVDPATFAGLGAVGPWSVAPAGAADGALAYLTNALQASYKPMGGATGDTAGFEAMGRGNTRLARGLVLHPPGVARTVTGTGTSFQLGVVPTGKRLYVNLHVLSVSGTTPSMTVRIESDDNAGFTTPITVATFAAATAASGQHLSVAGPTTDSWWRVGYTITGTTPSFLFVVTAGIA